MSLKDISALSPREILSRLFAQAAVDAVLAWLNKQLNPVQTSFAKPSISLCLSLFFSKRNLCTFSMLCSNARASQGRQHTQAAARRQTAW